MQLILIRHGQSHANANGLLIADELDDLNDIGTMQATTLKQLIESMNIIPDRIYSSPWRRASRTAELLFDNASVHYDPRLAETNPGIYGTWLEKEFMNHFPEFSRNMENQYEGGESHWQMAQRVIQWIQSEILHNIDSLQGQTIVVVCHGGPISVMLQTLLSISIKEFYPSFTVPNASVSILNWHHVSSRFIVKQIGLIPFE